MKVVVVVELEDGEVSGASRECLAEGVGLGGEVWGVVMGDDVATAVEQVKGAGVVGVIGVVHEGLGAFSGDGWVNVLEEVLVGLGTVIVLTPNSGRSRVWVPRVGVRLERPVVTGCTQVRVQGGELELTRPFYSGLQREVLRCGVETAMLVTLQAGVRGVELKELGGTEGGVRYEQIEVEPDGWRDRVSGRIPADVGTVDISEAERIVAGGLGLGEREKVGLLEDLARPLNATIGGTRVISDRGWIEHERYIGSTGKIVNPKLYIALGISGASQHTVGIARSETIVAVNIDRTAPIFGLADLGVVGDLHEIVPRVVARLKGENENEA